MHLSVRKSMSSSARPTCSIHAAYVSLSNMSLGTSSSGDRCPPAPRTTRATAGESLPWAGRPRCGRTTWSLYATALPRAGSVEPVTQGAHHLHVCNACTVHVYNTFMFSIQCLLYRAVTQQMNNVALSCLLAMANVPVSYCRCEMSTAMNIQHRNIQYTLYTTIPHVLM